MSKEIIRKHIEDCMKSYFRNMSQKEVMHQRLDELFLLWSKVVKINFVESVEAFGLDYDHFHYKHYDMIWVNIGNKFPKLKEEWDSS